MAGVLLCTEGLANMFKVTRDKKHQASVVRIQNLAKGTVYDADVRGIRGLWTRVTDENEILLLEPDKLGSPGSSSVPFTVFHNVKDDTILVYKSYLDCELIIQ